MVGEILDMRYGRRMRCVVAGRGIGGTSSSHRRFRPARTDNASPSRSHDAGGLDTSAPWPATCTIHRPGKRTLPAAPNLRAMNTMFAPLGSSRVPRDRADRPGPSTPAFFQRLAHARLTEPRHAHHALVTAPARLATAPVSGPSCRRRPDHDIARRRLQLGDQLATARS